MLVWCEAGGGSEDTQKMKVTQSCEPGKLAQGAGLVKPLFHVARNGGDALLVALGNSRESMLCAGVQSCGGQLQSELIEWGVSVGRNRGTGDERGQVTGGRQAVTAKPQAARACGGGDALEGCGLEMK